VSAAQLFHRRLRFHSGLRLHTDCRAGTGCCPDDGNPCTHEFCDQTTGQCSSTPDCTADTDCDDHDVCTTDMCVSSCCGHTPIECPARPCFRLTGCDPINGCLYVPDCRTGDCCPDDGNPCTHEFCDQATGACGSRSDCTIPADCDDGMNCTVETCDNSCCGHTPLCPSGECCADGQSCDDGDECTTTSARTVAAGTRRCVVRRLIATTTTPARPTSARMVAARTRRCAVRLPTAMTTTPARRTPARPVAA